MVQTIIIRATILICSVASEGGLTYDTNIVLTEGVGRQSYRVQRIVNLTIIFTNNYDVELMRHIY